jgi:hypothetical protein
MVDELVNQMNQQNEHHSKEEIQFNNTKYFLSKYT